MKMQQIRAVAEERGIAAGTLDKVELVRAIQRVEGNFDCFATAWEGICDQYGCRWREDCFELAMPAATVPDMAAEATPEAKKQTRSSATAKGEPAKAAKARKASPQKTTSPKTPSKTSANKTSAKKASVKKTSAKKAPAGNEDKGGRKKAGSEAPPARRKLKSEKD